MKTIFKVAFVVAFGALFHLHGGGLAHAVDPVIYTDDPVQSQTIPVGHRTCDSGCDSCASACDSCDSGCDRCDSGCSSCDSGCDACDSGCCDSACDGCGSRRAVCGCSEPWRLFPADPHSLQAYGWINGGITFNAAGNPSRFNGTVRFNDRDRELQLNQMYAVLERTTDPNACGLQIGGRADVLYGTDGRFVTAIGLERGQNGNVELNSGQRFYHLAFPQFYLEARYNDWQLIAGHFYSNLGYERVTAPDNFFYSHSNMFAWGEPFTFTGGLLKWQATDQLQLRGGLHTGWNNFSHNNHVDRDDWGAIAGFTWTTCDKSMALHGNYTYSKEVLGFNFDRNLVSIVFDWRINDRWQYAAQVATGWQPQSVINEPVEWQGISQYLYYTVNDTWKAGLRAEWFRDDDASRVHGLDYLATNDLGNPSAFQAYSGAFYQMALGLNWTPNANVVVRPEVRWDWFDNANVQNGTPFGDNGMGVADQLSQFLFGIDAIITF